MVQRPSCREKNRTEISIMKKTVGWGRAGMVWGIRKGIKS